MTEYILYAIEVNGNKFILRRDERIEDMDGFTCIFKDEHDMNDTLNDIYGTQIKLSEVHLFEKKKNKESQIFIKYSDDLFDEISVIEEYKKYLWENPKRILYSNVKHVKLGFMEEYKETGKLKFGEREFDMAIHAYFYHNGELIYSKVRDAYFELLELGKNKKCKKK